MASSSIDFHSFEIYAHQLRYFKKADGSSYNLQNRDDYITLAERFQSSLWVSVRSAPFQKSRTLMRYINRSIRCTEEQTFTTGCIG